MEDEKPPLSDSSAPSARSATALRELESRARAALTARRQQMLRLESEITSQLDTIEETLAAQQAADSTDSIQTEAGQSEIERLREEAARARSIWETERAAQQAEFSELRAQLSEQQREQAEQAAKLKELERQLAEKETALAEQVAALNKREAEQGNQDQALEAIHWEREVDKKSQADREAEWEAERAKWLAERTAWDAEKSAWDAQRKTLEEARSAADAECAKRDVEKAAWEQECAGWNAELTAWATEQQTWTEERAAWNAERATLTTERDELSQKLVQLEEKNVTAEFERETQLADFEQKLRHVRNTGDARRAEWEAARLALEAERDELKQSLRAIREEMQSAGEQVVAATERDELQQKFELALNDVQRFRSRAAELEQELARRPAVDQTDSAELVALRAERDALAGRIEELERAPKGQVDADMERQTADLQRRFEMAVEDVRELKTKNTKLEAQLADRKPQSSGPADSGGMDWESQKKRLLASLAEEGDDEDDTPRQKDRTTIANTIEITDAVVAEKDREIKELRVQLAVGVGKTESAEARSDIAVSELVDADEVVQGHRKRLAELEKQMEETLRKAELELSVERAKMARQKSELELLRDELAQRESQVGPASGIVVPKKRWLSKLGLSGDEQG